MTTTTTNTLTPNAPELILIVGDQELRLPAATDLAELRPYVALISPAHADLPITEGVRAEHDLVFKTVTFGQPPAMAEETAADLDADLEDAAVAAPSADAPPAATGPTEQLEPNAPVKIIIYEGQETRVPIAIDNTVVRDFIAQTFPHLASATFTEGVREEGGLVYRTVELVKQAGRKGMDEDNPAATIAAMLARLPAVPGPKQAITFDVRRLIAGRMTFREALVHRGALRSALEELERDPGKTLPVADRLAKLPAIPLEQPLIW
ncbi:MAG TPA: hypothetical protein VNL77_22405 [Roseiflexaceae bacterium]|nr:hypothetical protein [Roseiflexaceae bacterium]